MATMAKVHVIVRPSCECFSFCDAPSVIASRCHKILIMCEVFFVYLLLSCSRKSQSQQHMKMKPKKDRQVKGKGMTILILTICLKVSTLSLFATML